MKNLRIVPVIIVFAVAVLPACKAKKKVVEATPAPVAAPAKPVEEKKSDTSQEQQKPEPPAPAPSKPNYNFSNIQFEFNSAVLKTASYQLLDQAAAEMKKDASAKFVLNGHSSAEGTPEHNMSLSVERATSVKTYLMNAGISGSNLVTQGYGESKPLTTNNTEEGRSLNRRVEIKLIK